MEFWKPSDSQPRPCCLHLRCKSMYYRADERPGFLHVNRAMGYWCQHTNEKLGPDETLAEPAECQSGRTCYESPPDLFGDNA